VGGEKPVTPSSHGLPGRRGPRVAVAVTGALVLLGTAGCGIQSTGLKVVGAAPKLQAANDVTGTESPGGGGNKFELYFFRDDTLVPVLRTTDQQVSQKLVISELIKGPSGGDQANGFTTEIPASLTLLTTTAKNQAWYYAFTEPLTMAEKAQIVCTVQEDLNAPSVGVLTPVDAHWYNCSDFTEDYGAPAYLPNPGLAAASPSPTGDAGGSGDAGGYGSGSGSGSGSGY
jgi:hypothetical protein